jgi:hypothetical protein
MDLNATLLIMQPDCMQLTNAILFGLVKGFVLPFTWPAESPYGQQCYDRTVAANLAQVTNM